MPPAFAVVRPGRVLNSSIKEAAGLDASASCLKFVPILNGLRAFSIPPQTLQKEPGLYRCSTIVAEGAWGFSPRRSRPETGRFRGLKSPAPSVLLSPLHKLERCSIVDASLFV